MSIENFHMYGGTFIKEMNVHDNEIHVGDDGQISTKLKGDASSGSVNTLQTTPPKGGIQMAPISAEMIKTAANAAIFMTDDNGDEVFKFSNQWQSVYRILKDERFETNYAHFTKMIQNLFPHEELQKKGKEKLYLKDATNFSGKDSGIYAKDFSQWKREDEFTGEVDPRYLIAEKFNTVLDNLRKAEWIKQNVTK